MRVVIRRFEIQSGQKVAVERTLDVDRVRVGRGTDQDLQVPDLRIALAHAEITLRARGPYQVTCLGANAVWLNGAPLTVSELSFGDVLDFGRFRVTVGRPEFGVDLLLEVEERISAREEKAQRHHRYRLTLADAGASKRPVAWILFLLFVLPGLAIPAALRFLPGLAQHGRSLDEIWQAGPPSAAHGYFVQDCGKCHEAPFEPVRNDACLACHSQRPHHSDDPKMLAQGGLSAVRCESCHHEHTGPDNLIAHNPVLCTACHENPAQRFKGTHLQPAHDFGSAHPVFTARLPRFTPGQALRFEEVRLDNAPALVEQSNLKFPHAVHLDPKGIKGPRGRTTMACADCHEPDAGGTMFKPVTMEKHCAACHRLDFDPADPERLLPHANAGEVVRVIHDYYAHRALTGSVHDPSAPKIVQERRRPGQELTRAETQAALAWADRRSALVVDEVFDKRVCSYCHTVERGADPAQPWEVAPVATTTQFFTGTRFTHAAHRAGKCERCHAAATSKSSRDVLLPALADCRECHGDPNVAAKVPTPCVACHGFHVARRATIGDSGTEVRK
jgi:hypothetical protein